MKKQLGALFLVQLAIVIVQCAIRAKRDTGQDDQFIQDPDVEDTCYTALSDALLATNQKLQKEKPPLKYMYPCEDCKLKELQLQIKNPEGISYKYDPKTGFFAEKVLFIVDDLTYVCTCHTDATEDGIRKGIDDFQKRLDSSCTQPADPVKDAVDPAKVLACLQQPEDEGESKYYTKLRFRVAEEVKRERFSVAAQEILDAENETVTYKVLPTPTPAKRQRQHPSVYRVGDDDFNRSSNKAKCLQKNNYFDWLLFAFTDFAFQCGTHPQLLYFTQGIEHDMSCRYGFDDA